jgi:rhodanese-related sulfurtransferase
LYKVNRRGREVVMKTVKRVSPQDVNRTLEAGTALLVCVYDDEDLFRKMKLPGALSLKDFRSRVPSLPKDQEIIFYCG